MRQTSHCLKNAVMPRAKTLVSQRHSCGLLTWFFPFSISRFVTFPNGSPSPMTSASFMSFGSLRTWTTRDGTLGLRTSLLNFFESLPLAAGEEGTRGEEHNADTISGNRRRWLFLNNGLIVMATQTNQTRRAHAAEDSPSAMATDPTWVHDIGPVGYAGRKEFVGSPLREKRKQWFTSGWFTNEGTARQVESAALVLPGHCAVKQEVM